MRTEVIATPRGWKDLQPHPLSALVEFGIGIDLESLKTHIATHGYDQAEAIIVHEGMILDGRHKHRACVELDIVPSFKRFCGRNAMAYVAKKLFRQHLNVSERSLLALKLTKIMPPAGSQAVGNPTTTHHAGSYSQGEAAQIMNVSRDTVNLAERVLSLGTESLASAVQDGTVSVSDAAKLVTAPPTVQDQAVEAVRTGQARTVASAFCPRCQADGPRKACPECRELRGGKPAREVGDEPKKKKRYYPPPGREVFDWSGFWNYFGRLARTPDDIAHAYAGEKESAEFAECIDTLTAFTAAMKRWQKRLTKG